MSVCVGGYGILLKRTTTPVKYYYPGTGQREPKEREFTLKCCLGEVTFVMAHNGDTRFLQVA